MKFKTTAFILSLVLLAACHTSRKIADNKNNGNQFYKDQLNKSLARTMKTLSAPPDDHHIPTSLANGKVNYVGYKGWTSGFYPGILWMLYDYSDKSKLKKIADEWTRLLEPNQYYTDTHDLGFIIYNSYGQAYKATHDDDDKKVIIQAAKSLKTRFNPTVGSIKSWDHGKWEFPVIIDNMMNLELLFEATKLTGDSSYYQIARTHALTTMKNHFRPDYSSFHVVNYDTLTGKVISKETAQGYSDSSDWARGQAWGLYGFTMVYRETGEQQFLQQAEHIAQFIMNNDNLPADKIPYWDYMAPGIPNEPRDASAAAITSSALLELAKYVPGKKYQYINFADDILHSLSSPQYFASEQWPHNFLLKHSTGNWPGHSEVDVPIIYADYYYIEALERRIKLPKQNLKLGPRVMESNQ